MDKREETNLKLALLGRPFFLPLKLKRCLLSPNKTLQYDLILNSMDALAAELS